MDTHWAKIKTKECLCEILVDDFHILIQSVPRNTRGPFMLVYEQVGTVYIVRDPMMLL